MRNRLMIAAGIAFVLSGGAPLRADADGAKGYIKQAQDLIETGDTISLGQAKDKLDLAEAELDGVEAGAKTAIAGTIAQSRQKVAAAMAAWEKPKYKRKLDRVMDDGESAIGNLATWTGAESAAKELFEDPAAKAALGPDLDAAMRKFATFRKLNAKKAAPQIAAQIEGFVKSAEDDWADAKTKEGNSRDFAYSRVEDDLKRAREQLKQLDKDDEHRGPLAARIDKVAEEYTQIALAERVKEVATTLQRRIDVYKDDWNGYDAETAGPGSWEAYRKESGEKMSAFLAPKTREFIMRQGILLEELQKDNDYQSVQSDKTIKAIVGGLQARHDAAYAKMLTFVKAVADDAAKATVKEPNDLERLKNDANRALGIKSPDAIAIAAALDKRMTAGAAAATAAEDAKVKLVEDLRAKATDVWPKLYEGIPYTIEIDMSHPEKLKDKNIGFLSDNLMGYRFKPGDFYFATTLGGIPVAAKIDPQLMKQIKATEAAIGRSLGDDDNDGKWDCIAVVTDQKTKLMARRQTEATGTVGGVQVKLTGEYAEPVDAVVIEIIAAKCGPFAGAKDHGVLKEDGTVVK